MLKLRSNITKKILGYFFLNPQKEKYINELAKELNLDAGNLFRKLKELEKEKILISEKRGNQKYYSLNQDYPLLEELKRIYNSNYGVVENLKNKLQKIKKLKEAYIFGSYAKNNLQAESDIDLLLIGDHSSLDTKKIVLPLEKDIGREINIVDFSPAEFKKRKEKKDDFIENVFSQKIIKII